MKNITLKLPALFAGMLTIACLLINTAFAQTATLIPLGSSWKYLDNGSDQRVEWSATDFNDNDWATGLAELGYSDGDEKTIVSYGSNPYKKYITTYFRKKISIADVGAYAGYTLKLKRDDGVVVYINGQEVYRNNMPGGTISYTTKASVIASDDGKGVQTSALAKTALQQGTNVVAAEIHQSAGSSSDISFDLSLEANTLPGNATLTREPYLQIGNPTSIVIRWRTNKATDSRVSFGELFDSDATETMDTALVTEHMVRLTNLTPNTQYYYTVGSSTQTLQGNQDNFFRTPPTVGTAQKTRVWAVGDCGYGGSSQLQVRDAYYSYVDGTYTNLMLLLGDNAYNNGLDGEYQRKFFDIYQNEILKQTLLYPTPGNHDYANNNSRQNDKDIAYYKIFTLPTAGESGGIASGSNSYYSYDYANIHFISLDSYGRESSQYRLYDTLSPQVVWLKKDLAANKQRWTIVYWHHPPYSMGSHNSDTETELVKIRENLNRILERYRVDLVLCGHSHDYERTRLIKNYYGNENSYNKGYALTASSGKYDGTPASCPYLKDSASAYQGVVYVVAGSAGRTSTTQAGFPHAAMYYADATNAGSLVLDIEDNRLDARFITADTTVRDAFTLMKDVGQTKQLTAAPGGMVTLQASWPGGSYRWSNGDTTRQISVLADKRLTYTVNDKQGCLTDVFKINLAPASASLKPLLSGIYPNPTDGTLTIEAESGIQQEGALTLSDFSGNRVYHQIVSLQPGNNRLTMDLKSLPKGMYFVRLACKQGLERKQVVVNK